MERQQHITGMFKFPHFEQIAQRQDDEGGGLGGWEGVGGVGGVWGQRRGLFMNQIKSDSHLCTRGQLSINFYISSHESPLMLASRLTHRLFSSLRLPSTSYVPKSFAGNPQEIISKRNKHFSQLYPTYYKSPLIITEGHLQYLFDHRGNRYLDLQANGGTVNIGHNHPAVRKVIQDQAGRLIHTSTIYMNETHGEYSQLILEQLGAGYESVYLCNSTGEAIDFSLMISQVQTEQRDIYAFRNAYHGLVGNARSVTNLGSWNSHHIDKIDCQRITWPKANSDASAAVEELRTVIDTASAGQPGTLVYEPLQAKAGVHIAPQGYLSQAVGLFQQRKGVAICDESSTGLGRIGKEQWGFKWQNHVPTVVTIGASLGNGSALAAVVTKRDLASVVKHVWFNTFAAGHMQTKLGIAVINTIKQENLAENAEKVGAYLLEGLTKAAARSPFIGAVRGKGLLIGIDVVENGQPSKARALQLMELGRERQLLFGQGGAYGNSLLVRPPLCITLEDAKYVVEAFEDSLLKLK